MPNEQVLIEQRDRVAIVTLNRPERLNAWGEPMNSELRAAIEGFNQDDGVGAVVITGAGRAFCSGADIQGWNRGIERRESGAAPRRAPEQEEDWVHFMGRSKPIVCAINGPAIGVGLTVTLSSDVRIASDRARLSMRFVRVGVLPELASTRILGHIVGLTNALELMLSGRIIDADEAARIGLVNRVVPHDELLDHAVDTAAEIASNPAESLLAIKRTVWANLVETDLAAIMKRENKEFTAAMDRPHFKEAVKAFLEKRQPEFNKV